MAQAVASSLRAVQQRARVESARPPTSNQEAFEPLRAADVAHNGMSAKEQQFLAQMEESGELANLQRKWLPQIQEQVTTKKNAATLAHAAKLQSATRDNLSIGTTTTGATTSTSSSSAQNDQAKPQGLASEAGREAALKRVLATRSISGAKDQIKNEINAELQRRLRDYVKKGVKKGIEKVVQVVTNLLGDVVGSSIVGLIVTAIVWLLTLGWWNVELFYGTILSKGKSKFIEPLSWDPFPIPLPVIVFEAGVIFLDLLVLPALILFILLNILPFLLPLFVANDVLSQFGFSLF